jgi:hypothetical protein
MQCRWTWTVVGLLALLAASGCNEDCSRDEYRVVADAGVDQRVPAMTVVRLDGSGSWSVRNETNGEFLGIHYTWTQVAGPAVTLRGADTAHPWFLAPYANATLQFELKADSKITGSDRDTVQVFVTDTRPTGTGTRLGGREVAGAEISAYYTNGDDVYRVFTTNQDDTFVHVTDISNPAAPASAGTIDLSENFGEFDGDAPTSVSVWGNWLAVAVPVKTPELPGEIDEEDVEDVVPTVTLPENPDEYRGVVQFYDAATLAFLKQVPAGALPDMVAFSPNGMYCLTANEGEPNEDVPVPAEDYFVDPEGSVTIIRIPQGGPASIDEGSDVFEAGFGAFNTRIDELREMGVRLYAPGATVSQDMEPEYLTFVDGGLYAVVACQENNAIALVSLNPEDEDDFLSIVDVQPLGLKKWDDPCNVRDFELRFYLFPEMPDLGTTLAGQTLKLGGFSGVYYTGIDETTGAYSFVTIPDRGPNLGTVDVNGDGVKDRPFPLPDYQARIVRFTVNPEHGSVEIQSQMPLWRADGTTPITGRPNHPPTAETAGLAYHDEPPVNLLGQALTADTLGGDFEGIVVAPDGTYWMCDEYRPAIYHFSANGILIDRFVPEGTNAFGNLGTEAFPAVYAQRRANRGFEALAYDPTAERLYAFIQSPLDVPDVQNDANSKASYVCRILEFDPEDGETTGEFVYVIDKAAASDKIGDAVWSGKTGQFYVIERNSSTGAGAVKNVFKIDLATATNLQDLDEDYDWVAGVDGVLEGWDPDELDRIANPAALEQTVSVVPVRKTLYVNLADRGYRDFDKPEGLALLPGGKLAVLNDNDFGIAGATADFDTGLISPDPDAETRIAVTIVDPYPVQLDASNRDGIINMRTWPVYGVYHPDAITSFTVGGRTFVVSANEGDAREYEGGFEVVPAEGGENLEIEVEFVDETRVEDEDLDPTSFPNPALLQLQENLGRLKMSNVFGDLDGDGDFDRIEGFGARSFSIWNGRTGALVFDSGDLIARRTIEIDPTRFNSEGDASSFDDRSDDKGTEPEAVLTGEVDGVPYLFVGLERFGGVMVFDVRNPASPIYVTFLDDPADVSPEGLVFVPAGDSPNGQPLLIGTYEESGTIAIFQLSF